MSTQTFQPRTGSQAHPLRSVLLSIAVVVGVVLILRACLGSGATITPANDHTNTVGLRQAQAPVAEPVEAHGPEPTTMPDASKFPAGTQRDVRVGAPVGWQPIPDCKSDGLRRWTHEDSAGNITYYCAK